MALQYPPLELEPWKGSARGFDFTREVQPLLNQKCAGCHDTNVADLDLRPRELVPDYQGPILSHYDHKRLHVNYRKSPNGERRAVYTPGYESLVDYIRRVGAGDSVSVPNPGEYRANTSPLIQILERGHHGVELTDEEWQRLYMWIDLNGPQHGSWLEVYDMPPVDGVYEQRYALRKQYGSKQKNLDESFPEAPPAVVTPAEPAALMEVELAKKRQEASAVTTDSQSKMKWNQMDFRSVPVAEGLELSLVRVHSGSLDSKTIESFWMAETEVSNALFAAFSKEHDSGYLTKRHDIRPDDKGVALNQPTQPVVRVSWEEAMAFCKWLSNKTGMTFTLPTESQWEYACRAGSKEPFFFGGHGSNFSTFANFADRSFGQEGVTGPTEGAGHFMTASDLESLHTDLVDLSDTRYRDGFIGTSPVNHFASNAFRLKNMHGNAAEFPAAISAGQNI
ncbi:MAG: formylglycine-generating enzyme family protein, partial [Coraliomargarita sp.]